MIIISVKIINDISGLLISNVIDPVFLKEFHDFLSAHELITRAPVEALECNIWTTHKSPFVLVKLRKSLS